MSDNRRRRKSQQSGGSDDLSDSYDELNVAKETQSSEQTEDHHDSEYDTAGSESDAESQGNHRESGDGQEEEKPQKVLDDDEDRRNPQYIPKRGTFYEHDDRTADEVNDETAETQPEREVKDKKVWKDKEDRWDHDRYNDEEQAPKSHAELIAVYGYDIRNEEGPPRARRRRRYGRGPNKYTRNWEDEDAYGKVAGNVPVHKTITRKINRTGEEFPSLNSKDNDTTIKQEEQPVITSAWYSNKNKVHPNKTQNFPPLQQNENQKTLNKSKQFTNSQANENKPPNERNNTAWKKDQKTPPFVQNANETNAAAGDTEKIVIVKTAPRDNRRPPHVQESVSLAASKGRGRGFKANTNNNVVGSRTIESKPKGRGPGPMNVDNRRSNVEHEQIVNDMKHMNVSSEGPSYHHSARQNKHFYSQPSSQQHSTVVPPRMQSSHPQPPAPLQQQQPQQPPQSQPQDMATNRPKRYSSLRQRPTMAEGPPNPSQPNYQPAPQHTYYPPPQAGSSRAVLETPGYPPPGPYEQTPPPAAPMAGQPVLPMPPGAQPASYAAHAPPPFLVPPPQFIPSQTAPPSIINYVPGPNGPIFQPNYQGYNPAAVQPGPPPPQEVGLYQPQGCTYYSPAQQQQQQQQQPVPLRRPKAAIPILPPPDNHPNQNNRGRNRTSQQLEQQQQQQMQQEQLVQQQLQQHQQQLIQEQKQEQQQLQEKLLQQQQQEKLNQQKQEKLNKEQQEKLNKQLQEKLNQEQQQQQQQQEQLKQQQLQEKLVQQQPAKAEKLSEPEEKQNDKTISVIETPEKTAEDISKVEPVGKVYVNVATEAKVDLEQKLESVTPQEKSTITIAEKIVEPVVTETKVEQMEMLTKVEADVPDNKESEKATAPIVSPEAPVETANKAEEGKTELPVSNVILDAKVTITSEKIDEVSTKTADLVSSKTETDCSIKESAVIEEAAA